MDFSSLLLLIRESNRIGIWTHENADADAVGASLALKLVLEEFGKNARIVAPNSVSKIGKRLARLVGYPIETSGQPKTYDLIIFVDVRPEAVDSSGLRTAVIDHHEGEPCIETDFSFIDPSFASASEMVFEFVQFLLDHGELTRLPRPVAEELLAGIVADTADLKLCVRETLERILRISSLSGVELREVFSLLRTPKDESLRMACLKGASRLRLGRVEGVIVAVTQVSSFQGDVASSMIHLGADVALAAGEKKGVVSVSGRARTEIIDRGLNLARIMSSLASEVGGEGGGHAGAAALRAKGKLDEILSKCTRQVRREIRAALSETEGR